MGQNRGALVSPKKKARTQGFSEKAGGGNMEDRFNFAWHRKIEHFLKHDFPKKLRFDTSECFVLLWFWTSTAHSRTQRIFKQCQPPPSQRKKREGVTACEEEPQARRWRPPWTCEGGVPSTSVKRVKKKRNAWGGVKMTG